MKTLRSRALRVTAATFLVLFLAGAAASAQPAASARNVIVDVRAAIAQNDFALGERLLEQHRSEHGTTPMALEALSWLGRGALARKMLDRADQYAKQTHHLALEQLKTRKLDDERYLPIALGAAIEVQAHVMAERGERSAAIYFLRQELDTYKDTSIRTRIQKNVNLLTLEGKPAPALETREYVGPRPPTLDQLNGRPLVLFFWAHWCPDCKAQAPVLAKLQAAYRDKGLLVVGPTQRYGFVAGRQKAGPEQEVAYIDEIRQKHYAMLPDMPVPISQADFTNYGCSTTPTLVLVDRKGIVRLYHPGQMTEEELEPKVRALVEASESAPKDAAEALRR